MTAAARVLVTGATGYIGGRLVARLLGAGVHVRCFVRRQSRLESKPWRSQVDVVEGNILDQESLRIALDGISVAYYLVHSLRSGRDFHQRDVAAAKTFALAATRAGVKRIIYLGGLGDPESDLSEHLRSRQETGDALRAAGVPVTEFRAGVIVGSGSLSFEIIRYLTERLPVMICPKWVYTRVQPIAIRNVLDYLVAALTNADSSGRIIEIGGSDVMRYADMLHIYAKVRGLRRWLLPVPVLTPKLSSYWIHLVTPIPAAIARPLVAGLKNEAIARDDSARRIFPEIIPLDYTTAVELAVGRLRRGDIETEWSDAISSSSRTDGAAELTTSEGMILERRQSVIATAPGTVFKTATSIGGEYGWLYLNSAWRLRGAIDRLLGGVGLRLGRRPDGSLREGDALDFWRIEKFAPDRLLRLRAEMKVPGRAWLQFEVEPVGTGSCLRQTAVFAPKGLFGLLYWYGLYPIHALIFGGMHKRMVSLASSVEAASRESFRS